MIPEVTEIFRPVTLIAPELQAFVTAADETHPLLYKVIGPWVVFILPLVVIPTPEVFVRFPKFALMVMEPPIPLAIILLSAPPL